LLANVRIATVGPVTAAQLNQYGLRADVVTNATTGYSAQGLLQVLGNSVDGERWIVTTTNRSRDELRKGLESHGASTLEALCYETLPVQELRPTIRSALESQRVQFVTISSRAIGEASAQLLRDFQTELQPISLSPSVSQALEAMGWPANIQASQNTSQSMVDALVHHWKKQRQQI
jgi:uroporphyrinogen-III synthase